MNENTRIEQDLSEEQLQVITGGCADCTQKIQQAQQHHEYSKTYTRLYKAATDSGATTDAARYLVEALKQSKESKRLTSIVAGRQRNPYHPQ